MPGGTVHHPLTASDLGTLLGGGSLNGHTLARGDVIELAAGTTYVGSFTFPKLAAGTGWVYIVTSGVGSLPAQGTQISDSDIPNMATIQSPSGGGVAAGMAFAASDYRFVGIRFLSGAAAGQVQYGIFATGYNGVDTSTKVSTEADYPTNIVLDRCIVRGRGGQERDNWGIQMNAIGMAVLDSIVDQIQDYTASDSAAIETFMGGRQYLVQNSTLSAAGENFISGGTRAVTGTPTDFVFRGCYFYKPLDWDDQDPSYSGPYNGTVRAIKNLFELKNAQRVLVEDSRFSNSWTNARSSGQRGTAIVLTPRAGASGEAGIFVSDVEIRNSIIDNVETGIRTSNSDDLSNIGSGLTRVWFHNNLIYNIKTDGTTGHFVHFATNSTYGTGTQYQAKYLVFTHNTLLIGADGAANAYGTVYHEGAKAMMRNTVFTDNIIEGGSGSYTVSGDGGLTPINSLNYWHNNYTFTNNVTFGEGLNGTYPAGNWTGTSSTLASIGFKDYNGLDFRLNPSSLYAAGNSRDATDGKSTGANIPVTGRRSAPSRK